MKIKIKVCIWIKTINLYELILSFVPLCYELYNLYSANLGCRDSFQHIGPPFLILTVWHSVSEAKTLEPAKNLLQSVL